MFANVSVPVVPDPNYLQQLYPTQQQQQVVSPNSFQTSGPVTQDQLTSATSTQPTDIAGLVSLAITAGLGYFFQKQKTTTDRRTYMAADTTLKLAQNDQASDVKVVKLTYALSCMADIMGKYHREDMETYQTIDGVSLWTYVENLNIEANQDFKARYLSKPPVQLTGSQSKDKVVATLIDVQQSITPTPVVSTPDMTKTGHSRPEINKEASKPTPPSSTEKVGIDTD